MEMLGQVPPRATLHPPPEGVLARAVRAPGRARSRLATGEDAHAAVSGISAGGCRDDRRRH